MIERIITKKVKELSLKFPLVALTGPRQSGKTTLIKQIFSSYPYVSLEDLDTRSYAQNDPRGFLNEYKEGAILDEIQRVPELFSYLQTIVDQTKKAGHFILSGSHNFLILENLTQSLAGRVAILHLLPLSQKEMKQSNKLPLSIEDVLFKGSYPRIYQDDIEPTDWYPSYIQTYVERDLRQIKNITDLSTFQRFLKMCAARSGQMLNLSSLANDCGVTHNTAKSWLAVLEASFIAFSLEPYFENIGKRLVKIPKLYFYDTGLLCSLLDIEEPKQISSHYLRGGIFESYVVSEMLKVRFNKGAKKNLYFWRDKTGHEVDLLMQEADQLQPIEIKSGKTILEDYFDGIKYLIEHSRQSYKKPFVVYAGDRKQDREKGCFLPWDLLDDIFC